MPTTLTPAQFAKLRKGPDRIVSDKAPKKPTMRAASNLTEREVSTPSLDANASGERIAAERK